MFWELATLMVMLINVMDSCTSPFGFVGGVEAPAVADQKLA